MSDAQINDLKEFISVTVSGAVSGLEDRLERLEQKLELLRTDMNDGFAAIADAISSLNDSVEDHERRITLLEQRIA